MTAASEAFDDRHQLSRKLEALAIPASADLIERLWTFTQLLLKWNRTFNLTGARNEDALVAEHLLDSLAATPLLERRIGADIAPGQLLVDVGSGAGFPGLVIASVYPDWPIALVEPIGKKAAFLQQAAASLGLRQAQPISARLEDAGPEFLRLFPTLADQTRNFTCRAVASLETLLAMIRPVATPQSRLFALKSRFLDEELAVIPDVTVHLLEVPGLPHSRTVVEVSLTSDDSPLSAERYSHR